MGRLIIDGAKVYELDESCLREQSLKRQRNAQSVNSSENKRQKQQKKTTPPIQ